MLIALYMPKKFSDSKKIKIPKNIEIIDEQVLYTNINRVFFTVIGTESRFCSVPSSLKILWPLIKTISNFSGNPRMLWRSWKYYKRGQSVHPFVSLSLQVKTINRSHPARRTTPLPPSFAPTIAHPAAAFIERNHPSSRSTRRSQVERRPLLIYDIPAAA
jgi:hypothetical protein